MKCKFEGYYMNDVRIYDNGVTIMLKKDAKSNTWEIYYETDGFPLTFGFGVPDKGQTKSQLWALAEANCQQICMAIFLD